MNKMMWDENKTENNAAELLEKEGQNKAWGTSSNISTIPFYHNADKASYSLLKKHARENRNNMTEAESILWRFIRKNSLGKTFLRQYIIGDYIVDFVCLTAGLIIEVDGAYHSEPRQQDLDMVRQQWLESQGFTVCRFSNDDILYDTFNVINKIKAKINP